MDGRLMLITSRRILCFGLAFLLLSACNSETKDLNIEGQRVNTTNVIAPIPPGEVEHLPGGDTSVSPLGTLAFSKSSRNLVNPKLRLKFGNGNHFFENPWVAGNQSTRGRDGLGPYFNSNACQNCHIKDGRGHAGYAVPDTDEVSHDFASLLIRVSKSNITIDQEDRKMCLMQRRMCLNKIHFIESRLRTQINNNCISMVDSLIMRFTFIEE